MKLDTNKNNNDVGDDFGDGGRKYVGTVVGIDGCVYGMPYNFTIIVQYDPFVNDTTSFVEEDAVIEENGGGSPMEDD